MLFVVHATLRLTRRPPASWSGVRDATTWSDGCPQICDLPPGTCPPQWSEDCLYLNVFTPATATADSNLPVLFWIPGGRYLQGAAGMSLYDGSVLAKEQNVVVVTTNYRLGVLGFAYVDGRANWGIRDQIQALQWVQNNIKAFGGDPSSVTLSGQSAGGTSVATLLVSPLAKGLYSRAIMESDPAALRLKQASEASTTAQKMAEALGCAQDDLVCLRAASVDDIMQAQGQANKHFFLSYPLDLFYPETPFVGDDVLAAEPLEAILGGSSWNHVPLMVGNVKDEGIMFVDSGLLDLAQPPFSDAHTPCLVSMGRSCGPPVAARVPRAGDVHLRPVAGVQAGGSVPDRLSLPQERHAPRAFRPGDGLYLPLSCSRHCPVLGCRRP